MVVRKGKVVEEGTHESLLENEVGVYYGLVNAQELATEAEAEEEDSILEKVKTAETDHVDAAHDIEKGTAAAESEMNNRGLMRNFATLVYEQRRHWLLYTLVLISIFAAGAVYPLQAYIFANIVDTFTLPMDQFVHKGNFWSGMFGIEAAGVGLAYFALGVCSHLISIVSCAHSIPSCPRV